MTDIESKLEKDNKKQIDEIKKRLKQGNEPINCKVDEMSYIKKPIGNAIYTTALENKSEPKIKGERYNRTEKVLCDLCGRYYTRSNKYSHIRTRYHLAYKGVNDKFKQFLLN